MQTTLGPWQVFLKNILGMEDAYGNNGVWFQNPLSDVMVFEEFCGQIMLQRMLQFLDPYPLALEVKGACVLQQACNHYKQHSS